MAPLESPPRAGLRGRSPRSLSRGPSTAPLETPPRAGLRGRSPRSNALVALVVLTLAAGCGPSASGETVLRFWAMGREGEEVAKLLPDFERDNPCIRVKVQQLPWTAAHEKLLTAFAGDATPDVCQL